MPVIVNWLAQVPDKTLLTDLSLIGTHDTMAYQGKWKFNFVQRFFQTQELTLSEQLARGVRFLDLRVSENMQMHHQGIDLRSSFVADVLPLIDRFLKKHPSEMVIARIKSENKPDQALFDKNIAQALDDYQALFVKETDDFPPSLKEVRGKLVVLDNTKSQSFHSRGLSIGLWGKSELMEIQDNYRNPKYVTKLAEVLSLLEVKKLDQGKRFYFNHVSATGNICKPFSRNPRSYATYLNPKVIDYLSIHQFRQPGILIFDFITLSQIETILLEVFGLVKD